MDKTKVDDFSADESLINLCDLNGDSITMVIDDSNLSKQSKRADITSENKNHQAKSFLLIENDRDIPDFLELEHRDEIDLCCCEGLTKNVTTRCTQTRISGVNESINVMLTTDLNHPATILNKKKSPIPNQYTQDLMLTRSQLGNVNRKYQKLKERFHKLHSDYHKLMGIAKEFTIVLGNAACGKSVDPQKTLATCMKIYPDLFDPNIRHEPPVITPLGSTLNIHNIDNEMKKFISSAVPLSPKHLDYKKIKIHLIHGNIRTKMLLLQALRWTITLSQPEYRDEVIHEYIRNDLLGLHGQIASDTGKLILPYLLMPLDVVVPHPIQQSAARLLNAFASLKCGRDYLAVGPTVLNVVIQCLDSTNAESIDAFTCDMIIAMLQKLSLRRQQRLYMIAAGLVEWLTHHLKSEYHSMGTYRLEYATALLMNLSLHNEAQMRAAEMSTMIISTLIVLLSTNHLPALQYVNGALNNFLTNKFINDEAKHIGLGSILEHHRKQRTGELRAHLDDILMKHKRQQPEMIQEEINDDDDREEYDVLEDELDEIDPVKVNAGDLFGETLLAICYCLTPNHLQVVQDTNNLTPRTFNLYDETSDLKNSMNHMLDEQSLIHTSQRITHYPRLTPANHKAKYKNPVKLESQNSYENDDKLFYATIRQSDSNETIINKSCLSLEIKSVSQTSIRAIEQRFHSTNIEDNFNENNIIKNSYYNEQEFISSNSRIKNAFTDITYDFNKDKSLISKYLKISPHKISSFNESKYYNNKFYMKYKSKESTTLTAESTHEVEDGISNISIISFDKEPTIELDNNDNEDDEKEKEEEGFAAKPKISRTPLNSAKLKRSSSSNESIEKN